MPAPTFDHRLLGSSEAVWGPAVAALPELDVGELAGPVVVVAPHPDDEVLAVGGLVQRLVTRRTVVRLVSLTDGEAADPGDPSLGSRRRAELADALRRLGVGGIPVIHVGLPDGGLRDERDRLADALADAATGACTLLAPLCADGHPDHDAAGAVAAEVGAAAGTTVLHYPIWAWHWATPGDLDLSRAARVPLEPDELRRKRDAIGAFVSQLSGPSPILGEHVRRRFERPVEVLFR